MAKRTRRRDGDEVGFWELTFELWRASGQSVSVFCKREGLCASSFYRWRGELGRRGLLDVAQPTARRTLEDAGIGAAEMPAFVPVKLVEEASQDVGLPMKADDSSSPPATPGTPNMLEVILRSGHVLRIGERINDQTLAKVVTVLERIGGC